MLGVGSWVAREDASREVLVGLYVRDAIGVVDPTGLPRLQGTGLPDAEAASAGGAPRDERLAWSWFRWWAAVLDADSSIPRLPDPVPAWEAALRHHLDDARTWAEVAHTAHVDRAAARRQRGQRDLDLTELVAEREAELGRRSEPFRLRIEVLPLVSAGIWWIGDDAIAVDAQLRDEPVTYREALRPIVDALV